MSNTCNQLHNLFNSLPKHKFPFNINEIPLNGVYILFEKNELAHDTNRIVRIGTHTGNNQLISRLNQHFVNENKDRSIFRKNIGRALLNKNNDPFLKFWELDLTTKNSRILNSSIDFNKQKQVEHEVTKYIQEKFSFVVFEVNNKEERLKLESKLISTISQCNECKPSLNWLGLFSTKEKIRTRGLWLVNELNKEPLSEKELLNISALLQVP